MKADSQVSGLRKSAFGRKAATPFSIQIVLAAFDSSCVRLFIHTKHEKQGPDITKNIYITGTHHSLRLLRETSRSVPWYGGITTSCCYKSSATIQQINSNFSTNTRPPLSLPDSQPWLPLPARLLPSVLVQHAENHQKNSGSAVAVRPPATVPLYAKKRTGDFTNPSAIVRLSARDHHHKTSTR